MEHSITLKIDADYGKKKIKMKYPYLFISRNTDAIAVVLSTMPEGDLPVVFKHNGKLISTVKIKRSPLVLKRILQLYPLTIFYSDYDSVEINNISELMGEERLWMPS